MSGSQVDRCPQLLGVHKLRVLPFTRSVTDLTAGRYPVEFTRLDSGGEVLTVQDSAVFAFAQPVNLAMVSNPYQLTDDGWLAIWTDDPGDVISQASLRSANGNASAVSGCVLGTQPVNWLTARDGPGGGGPNVNFTDGLAPVLVGGVDSKSIARHIGAVGPALVDSGGNILATHYALRTTHRGVLLFDQAFGAGLLADTSQLAVEGFESLLVIFQPNGASRTLTWEIGDESGGVIDTATSAAFTALVRWAWGHGVALAGPVTAQIPMLVPTRLRFYSAAAGAAASRLTVWGR